MCNILKTEHFFMGKFNIYNLKFSYVLRNMQQQIFVLMHKINGNNNTHRISFAIFISEHATVFKAPDTSTNES